MTIQETARILAIIGTVHQWVTSGDIESKVKVWWALLQDMPYDEAVRATMKVLAESEKEPKPAAIRAAAESFRTESQAVSGEIAWLEVSKKLNIYAQHVEFSTPEIAEAVRSVGIRNLAGDSTGNSMARFMRIYDSLIKRKREQVRNAKVQAMFESLAASMAMLPQSGVAK